MKEKVFSVFKFLLCVVALPISFFIFLVLTASLSALFNFPESWSSFFIIASLAGSILVFILMIRKNFKKAPVQMPEPRSLHFQEPAQSPDIKPEPPKSKAVSGKKAKIIIAEIFILLLLVCVVSCINSEPAAEMEPISGEKTTQPEPSVLETTIPLSVQDHFVSEFMGASGLSEDTANAVYSLITEQLLFDEVRFEEHIGSDGSLLWKVRADGYGMLVSVDDEGIYSVFMPNAYTLYDGEIQMTKDDILQRDTSEYRFYYISMAEEIVSGYLKSPSSADFCSDSDYKIGRNGNLVAVQGYVDSQNSFGAMIRSEFIVEMNVIDIETFSAECVYIQIGGQSAGKFIELD